MAVVKRDRSSFLFEEELAETDHDTDLIIGFEEERQQKKLVMIPSESIAPKAVRRALGSVFTNLYAEGWPSLSMTRGEIGRLTDFAYQLAYHRRYADRRFYRGCDYVNIIESLAQRRVAELFATEEVPAESIFAIVQALSGAAANNAVYESCLQPGDTIMGMSLTHGGHLTHGSEYNRSGKYYRIVSYGVNERTGKLDYDEVRKLALENQPRLIVAGASAYPWDIDWQRLREIADELPERALLMADIAHPAGMVVAGQFPNPVGYADVITFTTHKTLIGPRGAAILTTDEELADRIHRAVFPGEQGGPHVNNIAAMAVCFKIARTEKFRVLQEKTVENAQALAEALQKLGLRLAYGGTNTHMLLIDLNSIETDSGYPLKAETPSRILDLCGIVCNKNTIPGDTSAADASALRLGTTWLTQRGMGKEHMERIARLLHRVLTNIKPFGYVRAAGDLPRGKIDLKIIEEVQREVAQLEQEAARELAAPDHGYPHYFVPAKIPSGETTLLDEHRKLGARIEERHGWKMPVSYPNSDEELQAAKTSAALFDLSDLGLLEIEGERAKPFLAGVTTGDLLGMSVGQCRRTYLLNRDGELMDDVLLFRLKSRPHSPHRDRYLMATNPANHERVKGWLRSLSDGYVLFDAEDIYRKIDGPVVIEDLRESNEEEGRRVGLALHGPDSPKVLEKAGFTPRDIERFHFAEGQIGGVEALVARTDYADGDTRFELYVHPRNVGQLWNLLLQEGGEIGLKAAGLVARDQLRSEAGLPSYDKASRTVVPLREADQDSLLALSKPYFIGQGVLGGKVAAKPKKKEFRYTEQEGPIEETCLYQEHVKLTNKRNMIGFAGWSMPVWYTSISEEHRAVRETAGLFDLSHMGVLEIQGENATRFLDIVTTNYVPSLQPGQSHYSYILDPDGDVMDDVFLYRLAQDRYMLVVNAVNADKITAWLNAVNSREYVIDRDQPFKEVDATANIRDLRVKAAGKDRRVDMALQGPNSLAILLRAVEDQGARRRLTQLRKLELMEVQIDGAGVLVTRTGYTGEDMGFELYLNPDDAPRLWNLLLERGRDYGLRPTGLGARDSTRTEAGLPLYGHELAGGYHISPLEAGYGAFVKLHKAYFIGRKACVARAADRKQEVIRFRMNHKGIRMVRTGNPVVNRKGECIGAVTSCVAVEGIQVGLAYVDRGYAVEGTPIGIFPFSKSGSLPSERSKAELVMGDKVLLHEEATVLSRFFRKEEEQPLPGGG